MANNAPLNAQTTRQQMQYLLELRSYVHEEAGWIRTLTDAIQRGVAGEDTATEVGQIVADVSAPYRAEITRLHALTVPPGCEAVDSALITEMSRAEEYLSALARWVAAGQVGISLLRDNAGEDVHGILQQFVASREAFESAYLEAARLVETTDA